jgi:Uma2 family endonuclease
MSILEHPPEASPTILTFEEFLALPDDGVRRELIRGELRERGMTVRNRHHSRIQAWIVARLIIWLEAQAEPRGEIVCGEAGFRLRGPLDSAVGVDVAYVSAELVAATPPKQAIFDGPPVLAIEILSPSDTHEAVVEKVGLYNEVGTVAWVVDPDFKTVIIHRPGFDSDPYSFGDEIADEPYLPGFRALVSDLLGARSGKRA